MKSIQVVSLALLVSPLITQAKGPVAAKAANPTAGSDISVEVTYGDKQTKFRISPIQNGAQIDFSNNVGESKKSKITTADLAFLKTKIAELKDSNSTEYCPRKNIRLKTQNKELIGCLGSNNKTARGLQRIANLLVLY